MTFRGNTEQIEWGYYSACEELYIFYADGNEKHHLKKDF